MTPLKRAGDQERGRGQRETGGMGRSGERGEVDRPGEEGAGRRPSRQETYGRGCGEARGSQDRV